MRKNILLLFSIFLLADGHAQNHFTAIIRSGKEILAGASLAIKGSHQGAVADSNGVLSLHNIPDGKQVFLINHIGYKQKEIVYSFPVSFTLPVEIGLETDNEPIDEVIVQTTRTGRNLSSIPTRIEVVSPDELDEKGTMKPGDIRMLLNESTGITTQQTSAVSGTANIRIQGLDGRYTQLLKDGMPLYTGFSGGLSIMQIPPLDLKQVEYIKGSASTLYGGGAISGLVNLITKTPKEKTELNFLLNANSAKGLDANGFYAQKWKSVGVTVFGSYNHNGAYDPGNIGFSALPKTSRVIINPKLFLYFSDKTTAWLGVNTTFEKRLGGDMRVIVGNTDSTHRYFEKNITNRVSTQFSFTHIINQYSTIHIKNSIGIFDRDLSLPDYRFHGRQVSTFSEINYTYKKNTTEWVMGLNGWTEKFTPKTNTLLTYHLSTVGFFVQNTFQLVKDIIVETGLRIDKNTPATNEKWKGVFVLPRLNVLFKINESLSSRIGGGLGYKMPTPFIDDAERSAYQHVHAINFPSLNAEKSFGVQADINYRKQLGEVKLNINQFFFYTKLNRPILLQGNDFVNADGYIDTKGAETNLKLNMDELTLYLGYTYTDTKQHYNNMNQWQPLSAKHRVNADLTYEIENQFRFGVESFYTGEQFLSDGKTGRAFITFGLLAQKMWKHWDLFINVENLTDRRQTQWDTINSGTVTNPVFRDIYAPLDGVVVNVGMKIKL
jgi:iron complex outermembrane receptor protein